MRSHAAANGAPLDDETVRALLLLRARTLAAGYSGVRADLPARLLELLSLDLLPDVAEPSVPLKAVHALVRSEVPRMDIDREVAAQLAAISDMLPQICQIAAEAIPAFQ